MAADVLAIYEAAFAKQGSFFRKAKDVLTGQHLRDAGGAHQRAVSDLSKKEDMVRMWASNAKVSRRYSLADLGHTEEQLRQAHRAAEEAADASAKAAHEFRRAGRVTTGARAALVAVPTLAATGLLARHLYKKKEMEKQAAPRRAKDIKEALNAFSKAQGVDPKKSMIVAGGAMYMHGLRKDINDIDFFNDDLPDFVKAKHGRFEMDGGPGSGLPAAALQSQRINGMNVQTPEALLAFYQHLNRPKDQEKILRLETLLEKKAMALAFFADEIEKIAKQGLWDNIHAKRERIASGSGEKMRKPGSDGAPTATALRESKEKEAEVEYHGKTFPGYNQPIASDRPEKKKMVLAKKGDEVRLIHFGQKGYKHNYSESAKKNYLSRSAGIRGKGGMLTKDDKFSANYWARRELWPQGEPADGTAKDREKNAARDEKGEYRQGLLVKKRKGRAAAAMGGALGGLASQGSVEAFDSLGNLPFTMGAGSALGAASGAEKGRRLRAALGAGAGQLVGTVAGHQAGRELALRLGALPFSLPDIAFTRAGQFGGAALGGGLGAYLGHGKTDAQKKREKKNSEIKFFPAESRRESKKDL